LRFEKAFMPEMIKTEIVRRQLRTKRLMAGVSAAMLALGLATGGVSALAQSGPANNVQATAAPLAAPAQIAYDAAGNLYIADVNDNVIRKVDLAGIVTTVAGTGEQGFAGDGGPAASALLDSPAGVAVDASGNIYISDTHNQRIRRVSNGTITTIAGTGVAGFSGDNGAASAAQLSNPTALAVDANGNLYITDTDNQRIRKISGTTITTVAGNGEQGFSGGGGAATAAGIDSPNGVAVDAAGNIYIADTHNQRIRQVSNGTISTIAGNGSKSYGGDGGAATSALLARPRGLSVDAQGNIYVADSDNNRIRLIAAAGDITTVAGNGSQGFAGDGGAAVNAILDTPRAPAVQAPGTFSFSDTNNQLVRGVGADGIIHTIAGQNSGTGVGQGFSETLTLSGASAVPFGSSSLTATFSNAGQTATGQVSLLDITRGSALVGSAPLVSNLATIDTSSLPPGSHRLVASYAGDGQNPAITSSVFVLTVTPPPISDFTFASTGAATQSINPGQTATFNFVLQPQGGVLNSPITLTASGLPPGATAVFTPATIASGSAGTSFSLAIKTVASTAANVPPSSPMRAPLLPFSAAIFLLPLLSNKRTRRRFARMPRTLLSALFVLIAGAVTLGLTGCGGGGFFAQNQQSYTITVTATATSAANTTLQHTATVTLIVQ
jgi:sugar lactone lactonase YvrE